MKKVSHEIIKGGGVVRAVHNHGIRELPHRMRAKHADQFGVRYYTKGRFFSVYYDANPHTVAMVKQTFAMNTEILRETHLRARSVFDFVNVQRQDKNPYIKKVKEQEQAEARARRQAAKAASANDQQDVETDQHDKNDIVKGMEHLKMHDRV
jgi:ribosomal protein S6